MATIIPKTTFKNAFAINVSKSTRKKEMRMHAAKVRRSAE